MCVQDNSANCIWFAGTTTGPGSGPLRINFIFEVAKPRSRLVLVGGTHKATAEQGSGVCLSKLVPRSTKKARAADQEPRIAFGTQAQEAELQLALRCQRGHRAAALCNRA